MLFKEPLYENSRGLGSRFGLYRMQLERAG